IGNLEQCNGCGGCRKDAPTMCPTFLATGEEYMSTRGRANAIRAALELRFQADPLLSAELDAALSNCLSCKACTVECPSNVNLALLKAELMYARHQRDGLPLRERILSHVDLLGRHNLELLRGSDSAPILFLEPSCYSMFVEDYRELKLADTEPIAKRCHLFEQFIEDLLEREPDALAFKEASGHVAIHAHCHAKSLVKTGFMARLAARLPGRTAALLDTGCCGMAGAFGALERKYDLSLKVAAPLVQQANAQPAETIIVASGTSCRHQLEHLTD